MGFYNAAERIKGKQTPRKRGSKSFMDQVDDVVYNKWFLIGAIALIFIVVINSGSNTAVDSNAPIAEKEYDLHFSSRHSTLANLIKERLHDPNSFEFVKSEYTDNKDGTLDVMVTYRAKNGFGAVRTQRASAELDKDKKVFRKLIVEID